MDRFALLAAFKAELRNRKISDALITEFADSIADDWNPDDSDLLSEWNVFLEIRIEELQGMFLV